MGGDGGGHRYGRCVIDLHSHLLPGIDDGPRTMDDTLEMARMAVADGVTTMVCTPHMAPLYPHTTAEGVRAGVEAARAALAEAEIPLEVLPGAEIAMDWVGRMSDDDLRAASLGGNGTWLLLEMPFRGWPVGVTALLNDLELRGFRVVLAHPERAGGVQSAPERMRDLVGRGALVQVTAGSLTGEHGRMARQTARTLLRNGLVHLIASDSHAPDRRVPGVSEGLAGAAHALRVEPHDMRWMVEEGPRLVLAGGDVRPPRFGVPMPARPARDDPGPRRGRPGGPGPGRPGPRRPGRARRPQTSR
jgi:protein-tyrosine phosphatase